MVDSWSSLLSGAIIQYSAVVYVYLIRSMSSELQLSLPRGIYVSVFNGHEENICYQKVLNIFNVSSIVEGIKYKMLGTKKITKR